MNESKHVYGAGTLFHRKGSKSGIWYMSYYRDGRQFIESSRTSVESRAQGILRQKLRQSDVEFIAPKDRRVTVAELFELVRQDYQISGYRSLRDVEERWRVHLEPVFGNLRVSAVTSETISKFVIDCQQKGLSNATINRVLSVLRRAFRLGQQSTPPKVRQIPKFPHLKEADARRGFVEREAYEKLCRAAAGHLWLRTFLALGYTFGFRKSELLNLRCEQVDLAERTITLYPSETKSGVGRTVSLTSECYTLLQGCMMGKDATDYVLTWANKKPIRNFRALWSKVTAQAGCPNLMVHDLRRSAVRNLVRSGVSQHVAMQISGHRTPSVFARYDIVSSGDLQDAARKLEAAAHA